MTEALKRLFKIGRSDIGTGDTSEDKSQNVISSEKDIYSYTLGEIKDIYERRGDKHFLTDIISKEFAAFAQGRNGSLEEKLVAFSDLKAMIDKHQEKPVLQDAVPHSKESRTHSGFSAVSVRDPSYGLTRHQMELAKSAGMSFREYEESLNQMEVAGTTHRSFAK